MRKLCLDIGERRIGVALSDPMNIIATGVKTIDLKKEDLFKEIDELFKKFEIDQVIIGYPFNKTNIDIKNKRQLVIDDIALKISELYNVKVVKWDERFSTKAVERVLIEDSQKWQKRKDVVDKLAAQYILQGYLDSINK
ncbi:Holliday junction resolvase RuvX [Caldicellulosiruptoraceae bacterium PP1]